EVGREGLERRGERVGLVGIIDEDRRATALAQELEPALGAFEMRKRGEGGGGFAAGRDDKPGRDQRVLDLERAGQRQTDTVFATGMAELEHLREALDPALHEANTLPAPGRRRGTSRGRRRVATAVTAPACS